MSIQADSWIKEHSAIQNFTLHFIEASGESSIGCCKTMALKEALGGGFAIEHFATDMSLRALLDNKDSGFAGFVEKRQGFKARSAHMRASAFNYGTHGQRGPLVYPFVERSENTIEWRGKTIKIPSYGLTSYGYDIRLGRKFLVADGHRRMRREHLLDMSPNAIEGHDNSSFFKTMENDSIDLLPKQFMLGVSMEYANIPRQGIATCLQKSTIARLGVEAWVTPLEPEWCGYITLEIYNAGEVPVRLYAGQGIMQLRFDLAEKACETSYADRGGKYMHQPARPIAAK